MSDQMINSFLVDDRSCSGETLFQLSFNFDSPPTWEDISKSFRELRIRLGMQNERVSVIIPTEDNYVSGIDDEGLPNLIHGWIGNPDYFSDSKLKEWVIDQAARHREM